RRTAVERVPEPEQRLDALEAGLVAVAVVLRFERHLPRVHRRQRQPRRGGEPFVGDRRFPVGRVFGIKERRERAPADERTVGRRIGERRGELVQPFGGDAEHRSVDDFAKRKVGHGSGGERLPEVFLNAQPRGDWRGTRLARERIAARSASSLWRMTSQSVLRSVPVVTVSGCATSTASSNSSSPLCVSRGCKRCSPNPADSGITSKGRKSRPPEVTVMSVGTNRASAARPVNTTYQTRGTRTPCIVARWAICV